MRHLPLLFLLILASCQELAAPSKLSGAATIGNNVINEDLFDGPWKRTFESCNFATNECENIDIVVDFVNSERVQVNTFYAGTSNSHPARNLDFEIEEIVSANEFVMYEDAYGVNAPRLRMKYTINGNALKLCEDGMCHWYFRQ